MALTMQNQQLANSFAKLEAHAKQLLKERNDLVDKVSTMPTIDCNRLDGRANMSATACSADAHTGASAAGV